jgi:5-methylcytosine-specific restriction protein A
MMATKPPNASPGPTRKQRLALAHKRRPSPRKLGYDTTWQHLRAAFLAKHPLCQCDDCAREGRTLAATVVHHLQSIADRPDLRLDPSNLQAMAKGCHDRRTATHEAFKRRRFVVTSGPRS